MKIHLLACAISIGGDEKGQGWLAALGQRVRTWLGRRRPAPRAQIEGSYTGALAAPRLTRAGLHHWRHEPEEPARRPI